MKKLISLVVIMSLLITSQPSQANFFTDLFGGLFTVVSYPFQLILGSTKAPFFVAQNPFVEKEWHKEERVAAGRKPPTSKSQATDNAQPEEQDTPTPAITEPTPLPKTASPTPVPTPSIPAKKSVAPSLSPDKVIDFIYFAGGTVLVAVGVGIKVGGILGKAGAIIGGGGVAVAAVVALTARLITAS